MAKKKLKPHVWPGFSIHEQRTFELLHAAFGTLTAISLDKFNEPWQPFTQATWPRCPECMTWWNRERWPYCSFCRFKDPNG